MKSLPYEDVSGLALFTYSSGGPAKWDYLGEPGLIINTLDFSDSEWRGAWVSSAWCSNGLHGICGCVPVAVPENVLYCFITSFLLACSNPGLAPAFSLDVIESVES